MPNAIRHRTAALDAAALVERHDRHAAEVAAAEVGKHLTEGEIYAAIRMDQVRREAEAIHDTGEPLGQG